MKNYSVIQKFLHDLVFRNSFINKSLFEIEKVTYLKDIDIENQSHIFVTGLPRSGTTSLLNFLYSSKHYASLTYKNMPFILSPHFSKFLNRTNILEKERLHNDGIIIDINSPEALDEIFFNNDEEFIKDELINYIKLILLSENKSKYLSKNNLNYKRISLINSILPNAIFLIPIREPFQHAHSLLNQHLHFTKLQKKDDFIRRYMNYLGHNEFGLEHKSWNNPTNFNDFNNIDYWLEQWCLFYENILEKHQANENCIFIIYEELTNPNYLNYFLQKIDHYRIEEFTTSFKNSNKYELDINYSKDTYNNAKKIYLNFKNLSEGLF